MIFTIGHSTRSLAAFIALLQEHGITTVADIRRFPGSRRYPHFNQAALESALAAEGIRYVHLPRLGGRRHGLGAASPNTAWRNASFRAYADHMQSLEFAEGLAELGRLAERGPVALLCAEAVPWRCHRSLVADALVARGVAVQHILGPERSNPHQLTPFARIEGGRITYPGEGAVNQAPEASISAEEVV